MQKNVPKLILNALTNVKRTPILVKTVGLIYISQNLQQHFKAEVPRIYSCFADFLISYFSAKKYAKMGSRNH